MIRLQTGAVIGCLERRETRSALILSSGCSRTPAVPSVRSSSRTLGMSRRKHAQWSGAKWRTALSHLTIFL